MRSRRVNLLRFLLWMGLLFVALRPGETTDEAIELAASPLSVLAEIVRPLVWLRSSDVHAEDLRFFQRGAEDVAEVEALWSELFFLARPSRDELTTGRDFVPAEVVGRDLEDKDRLRVRVADARGIAPGMPVVQGNTYVGRVSAVDAATGTLEVELVTGARFGVGARIAVEGRESVWMTVGGLAAPNASVVQSGQRLALSARNPSDREPPSGPVEVFELLSDVDPHGELAHGFGLGTLVHAPGGEFVVEADVDYNAGLFHVFVVCPEGVRSSAVDEIELAVADQGWRPVRLLSDANPTPWRSGIVISRGSSDGVSAGAAVIEGLRLVGRVERAGAWSSDVRSLAHPGLAIVAVARIAGNPIPRVLGRLVSLGRAQDAPSLVVLRWEAIVEVELGGTLDANGNVVAELFTGSGEPGLPGGLYLGRATIVPGHGGSDSIVLLEVGVGRVRGELWVRTDAELP